ncbi:MAG: sulfatase-like hydrolase/transferase [Terriglobales bacterium]
MDPFVAEEDRVEDEIENTLTHTAPSKPAPSTPSTAKKLLVSVSLANLCLLPAWYTVVFQFRFFARTLLAVDYFAIWANIAIFSLLIWALFCIAERVRLLRWCRYIPFMVVSVVALTEVRRLYFNHAGGLHIPYFLTAGYVRNHFLRGAGAYAALILLLYLWVQHRRSLLALGFAVALMVSPFSALLLGQSAWRFFHLHQQPASTQTDPTVSPRLSTGNRVLWLILDELDYKAAFESRPPGLNLPVLDSLRTQSVFATHAYPPSTMTIASIPALLSGRRITRSKGSGRKLTITFENGTRGLDWSQQPNVFSEAHARGVHTAMLGWFIPYCRIHDGAFDFCEWYAKDGLLETHGLIATMLNQIHALSPLAVRTHHIEVFERMLQQATSLARDPRMGLVVIHLPVPHEPGIYDWRRNRFTHFAATADWYFGNLVLVDRTLGNLRRAMQEAGTWDKTAVMITSDHYWRTSQFPGKRDQRVPLLVKLPNQNHPVVVTQPLTTVILHDLVLVLENDRTTPEAVAAWLQQHSGKLPDVLPITAVTNE